MQLSELLPRDHIIVPLQATTVQDALGELVTQLAASDAIRDRQALEATITRSLGPTVAVGDDVALPHYRSDAVDELQVAIGVARQPLEPGGTGLEIRPRIVALILAPAETAALYLQTVSTLARFFRHSELLERVAGARTPDDVLAAASSADFPIQSRLTVRDIMVPAPARATPDTPAREIVDLMIRHRLGVLPVVGESGQVLGTITDRDIMRGLLPQIPRAGEEPGPGATAALQDLKVRDLMSRSVLCISEDSSLEEVASILINKDVPQLPVVHEGELSGMLSRGDVIQKLFAR